MLQKKVGSWLYRIVAVGGAAVPVSHKTKSHKKL